MTEAQQQIDLSTAAGFPLWLDGDTLRFGGGVVVEETGARTRGELVSVAAQPEACVPADAVQYWMYNGIAQRVDAERLAAAPVRYELTLILPAALGAEKSKTLGHIHNAPAPGVPNYQEIFEVLYGAAHFLFWTLDKGRGRADFCGLVKARAGERLVCPPDLYHLTINASDEPLLFADILPRRAFGIYDDVRVFRGAPYYEMTDGEWQRNLTYRDAAPLEPFAAPRLETSAPLYTTLAREPDAFAWLARTGA